MTYLILAMTVMAGGDTIELRDSTEGHAAELYYRNEAGQSSQPGVYQLEHNGIRVTVFLQFEPGTTREQVHVRDNDENLVPFPADPVGVADGEETVIQLMRPMF